VTEGYIDIGVGCGYLDIFSFTFELYQLFGLSCPLPKGHGTITGHQRIPSIALKVSGCAYYSYRGAHAGVIMSVTNL